jgi:hypothetical protein
VDRFGQKCRRIYGAGEIDRGEGVRLVDVTRLAGTVADLLAPDTAPPTSPPRYDSPDNLTDRCRPQDPLINDPRRGACCWGRSQNLYIGIDLSYRSRYTDFELGPRPVVLPTERGLRPVGPTPADQRLCRPLRCPVRGTSAAGAAAYRGQSAIRRLAARRSQSAR